MTVSLPTDIRPKERIPEATNFEQETIQAALCMLTRICIFMYSAGCSVYPQYSLGAAFGQIASHTFNNFY